MTTTYLQRLRGFSRDVRLFLVTSLLTVFCFMGVYLVLFNLYLVRLGYGPEFIGLANAAGLLVYGVSSLAGGEIGRRWGSRRGMIAGLATLALVCSLRLL